MRKTATFRIQIRAVNVGWTRWLRQRCLRYLTVGLSQRCSCGVSKYKILFWKAQGHSGNRRLNEYVRGTLDFSTKFSQLPAQESALYWPEDPGIESRLRWHFFHKSGTALGPTRPSVRWVPTVFPGVKTAGTLTTHSHLAPMLKKA